MQKMKREELCESIHSGARERGKREGERTDVLIRLHAGLEVCARDDLGGTMFAQVHRGHVGRFAERRGGWAGRSAALSLRVGGDRERSEGSGFVHWRARLWPGGSGESGRGRGVWRYGDYSRSLCNSLRAASSVLALRATPSYEYGH